MSSHRRSPLLALALALVLSAAGCSDGSGHAAPTATPSGDVRSTPVSAATGRQVVAAQWDRPADQAARVRAAGLDLLPAEALTFHFHAHLDVLLDGQAVPVPGGLGISVVDENGNIPGTHTAGQQGIAALHTHDSSGVVHIESPVAPTFTLGQVFVEWDVALADGRVGAYRNGGGTTIGVFVDGQRFSGDPATIVLRPHQEIAVVITTAGHQPVPAPTSYEFVKGQ